MLRQLSARLGQRARGPGRLASCLPRGFFLQKRGMASVKVEGVQKEPTDLDYITTLPNGLRVASEALPGSFAGVGIYIEAGSRFETPSLSGVSHIMDRLAFKSTSKHTADAMLERVEHLGGNIQCASSRESMMYQAATFNNAVPETVALLADTIRDPLITEEEVAAQIETARYEIAEIWGKPELILPELVHLAAYKDNSLGNPLLCPEKRLAEIVRDTVVQYREKFYAPDRMVLSFAGVNHNEAVGLAEQFFGDMKNGPLPTPPASSASSTAGSERSDAESVLSDASSATTTSSSSSSSSSTSTTSTYHSPTPSSASSSSSSFSLASLFKSADRTTSGLTTSPHSHYTGGFLSLPAQPASLNDKKYTHMHLAFEGLPVGSDDIYALATLQTLLGGGGSFSAGGPGKGMYSRLYTNVLNQHGWIESCLSFNHCYTDSGLFGISASCLPGHTSSMLDVICQELRALTLDNGVARLRDGEVTRAKNQLRSSLLMNLESRMIQLEDLGRSVQIHGRKVPVRDMCAKIEALTVQDLRRVASMVVGGLVENPGRGSGAPTVVVQEAQAYGLTSHSMTWDQIQDRIDAWRLGRRA